MVQPEADAADELVDSLPSGVREGSISAPVCQKHQGEEACSPKITHSTEGMIVQKESTAAVKLRDPRSVALKKGMSC